MSCNTYRPDLLGADCKNCPLGPEHNPAGWNPVPPEIHGGNAVAAVGEAPGADEEIELRPFVGKSGQFWNQLLNTLGIQREQVDLFNTIACRPPGNEFKVLETKTKKQNKQRLKEGLPLLKLPTEACAPRLAAEIANYPYMILLGNAPTKTILGIDSGILAARGVMRELNGRKYMPTVHPAFVLRAPHYAPVAVSDLRRALRGYTNSLYWPQDRRTYLWGHRPNTQISPAQELYQWFLEAKRLGASHFSYDVETNGKEPLRCKLRTISVSYLHAPLSTNAACSECNGAGVIVTPGNPDKDARNKASRVWSAWACKVLAGKAQTAQARDAMLHEHGPFSSCSACQGQGWRAFETDVSCVAIPILDPDDTTEYQTEQELKDLLQVLAWAFDEFEWIAHNGGSYDLQVMVRYCGTAPGWKRSNLIDTILLARMNNAELPKTLGVWGTIFTDVSSSWKADNDGKKLSVYARHMMDLLPYNVTDTVVTNRMAFPMWQAAEQRGQIRILPEYLKPPEWDDRRPFTLYEIDRCAQEFCVDLHAVGMFIDEGARAEEEQSLTLQSDKLRNELRDIAHAHGYPVEGTQKKPLYFNPGSGPQVARLLYDIGDMVPVSYTELDDPSVDDDALLEHLRDTGMEQWIRKFILKLRTFRRTSKMLSTYVKPIRAAEAKEEDDEGYFIWEDGRVRASWAAHTTNVGRLSCSGPNLTNIRKHYKRMYCAAPGHILVGCDLDQAHLRIVANAWQIPLFLEGFIEGIDPHGRYATWIFGEEAYRNAQGWAEVGGYDPKKKPYKGSDADKMRQVAKIGIYLFIYIGSADTAYQQFLATEDQKGRLIYLEEDENGNAPKPLEPAFVEEMRAALLKREPAFEKRAWPDIRKLHKRQGFLTDYLFGRRSDVLTYKQNEEVNFPVLATEASLMRLVECRVRKYFPRDHWGPGTGIINQCHDSITVEVPVELAQWAKETLLTCFTTRIPGWPVPFTAEADIGWFVDERGQISGGEEFELFDKEGKRYGKGDKGRKYRSSFNNRLKSRWSDT